MAQICLWTFAEFTFIALGDIQWNDMITCNISLNELRDKIWTILLDLNMNHMIIFEGLSQPWQPKITWGTEISGNPCLRLKVNWYVQSYSYWFIWHEFYAIFKNISLVQQWPTLRWEGYRLNPGETHDNPHTGDRPSRSWAWEKANMSWTPTPSDGTGWRLLGHCAQSAHWSVGPRSYS